MSPIRTPSAIWRKLTPSTDDSLTLARMSLHGGKATDAGRAG